MSEYGGNPSLASAVKERVTSTFQQAVELYKQRRLEEVIAGCGLILQMDPLYDPAKKLLEKARNPNSALNIDALLNPGARASATADSIAQARQAMAARDFERAIQITTEILTNDLMNDEARILSDEAREKIESGPFVAQFLRKAEQHLANGNAAGAKAELEKARALDAGHPGLGPLEKRIQGGPAAPAPSANANSFVVETPAAPARGAAQASDFGFTFEEDKNAAASPFGNLSFDNSGSKPAASPAAPASGFGGFSFETPAQTPAANPSFNEFSFDTPVTSGTPSFGFDAPPPASAGAAEYDFSTASIETSPDDQKKIEQYLADGDRAFAAGEYQQAIDLWSRIFLIDVTNDPASERIERAKAKRNEIESRSEAALAAGIQAFEKKDLTSARTHFNEVLLADSHNSTANDYMQRINSGAAAPAAAPVIPPSVVPTRTILDEEEPLGTYDSSLMPPEPAKPAAKKAAAKAAPAPVESGKSRTPLIAAAIAAVVLIAGGWLAWSKFMSQPAADPAATRAIISEATQLSQSGRYDLAISKLQDIKPGDAQYDKALVLIADLQAKKNRASAMVDGRPAAVFYQENLAAGRTAFDAHDYVSAKKSFEQAMRVKALPPDMKQAYDSASQQVAKLDTARTLFAERKYVDVVSGLTPMLQEDPQNKNIQRMIVDAHFNLGATALQEERLTDAAREFEEVLKSDPNDELARRSLDLAKRYDNQTRDLLYKIYVKYLPLRQAPVA